MGTPRKRMSKQSEFELKRNMFIIVGVIIGLLVYLLIRHIIQANEEKKKMKRFFKKK